MLLFYGTESQTRAAENSLSSYEISYGLDRDNVVLLLTLTQTTFS